MNTALGAQLRHRWAVLASRPEQGSITPFVVILLLVLILGAGLVLDGGRTLSARSQALDAAQAAARSGAAQLDLNGFRAGGPTRLDPVRAEAAAYAWLRRAGMAGHAQATPEGVTVTVTNPASMRLLRMAGLRTVTTTATASASPVQG